MAWDMDGAAAAAESNSRISAPALKCFPAPAMTIALTVSSSRTAPSRSRRSFLSAAPNAYFMRKAAEMGRGTFTFIGKAEEVQQKMSELFDKLEPPVLTNPDLAFGRAHGAIALHRLGPAGIAELDQGLGNVIGSGNPIRLDTPAREGPC